MKGTGMKATDMKGTDRPEDILRKRGYLAPCLAGRGAFSEVYRVKNERDKKHYACKISRRTELLFREAEFLRELDHPLFPGFCEIWQEEETGFLVTEYVSGRNLEKLLQRRGRLSARQSLRLATELAEGLAYLHERPVPVLYRDLKPGNIQIREDGRVKLLDFGCACRMGKENREREIVRVGTPGYAAPEQLSGETAGTAGDIYAFGRVLQRVMPAKKWGADTCEGRLLAGLAAECTKREPEQRPAAFRLCLYLLSGRVDKSFFKKHGVEKYIFDI